MPTDMGSGTQGLFDPGATFTTILAREMRRNRYDRNIVDRAIVLDPPEKATPRGITDGLGQVVVLDQIGDLEILVGNQVVRRDKRVCRFPSKIFTLPTDLEIRLAEFLPRLCAIR